MGRPSAYPEPEASKSTYVAIRAADGEIDWGQMRLDRPIPCFLHPEYAAPETGACLHNACISCAIQPHSKGLLGLRLKVLRSGYRLRGDSPTSILEDIALELLARYRKIDVPVTHSISSLLNAVEAVGVRHWGWACWEPDWNKGAGRTALLDRIDDMEGHLDLAVSAAYTSMVDPFTHTPEGAMRGLELAAATDGIPTAIVAHLLGELSVADLVRMKVNPSSIKGWEDKLREAYTAGRLNA